LRFHEALALADVHVVIGYGFRDTAINARIVACAARPGGRRIVVVHPDPASLGGRARGAISVNWSRWQNSGLLRFVPEYLSHATTWASIRDQLEQGRRLPRQTTVTVNLVPALCERAMARTDTYTHPEQEWARGELLDEQGERPCPLLAAPGGPVSYARGRGFESRLRLS
jgi:hypothetical protein